MSIFNELLDSLRGASVSLECYDRRGNRVRQLDAAGLIEAIERYRTAFTGWGPDASTGRRTVGLFFKSEETIEFLVATFAAIAEGFTVVPFYPNWSAETQRQYLGKYGIEAVAVGDGFRRRVRSWQGELTRTVHVQLDELPPRLGAAEAPPVDRDRACAWIFTSGTSGEIPKCTVITEANIAAAVRNIRELDFIREGMTLHSPLSTSHIFAFVVVLGLLAVRPRRLLFSDVQYLARLPQERIGKIDGLILVPLVLNRMRSGVYEQILGDGRNGSRVPWRARRLLRDGLRAAERAVLDMEQGRPTGFAKWPLVFLSRHLVGRRVRRRLGSPDFVVVGGAKPSVDAMAFLDAMGVRCLQGWGMTETTGPLAVCRWRDRYRGAYGTCGALFDDVRAELDGGELIVEGPQIASGYLEPDGTFVPFRGRMRTGDYAEFDRSGRLRVTGKVSDRITLANGLNYNPIPLEEAIVAEDLRREHRLELAVVIGDGQPRLGCVFFLNESGRAGSPVDNYLEGILRAVGAGRAVDEQIGVWRVHDVDLRESGFLGPSGKLRRPLVERHYSHLFDEVSASRSRALETTP